MADRRKLHRDRFDIGDGYNMSFEFEFVEQTDGTVRIYILKQPSYRLFQAKGAHETHRYGLGSRPYICYEPQPRNLEAAIGVASEWAKRTAYYIRHNKWPNVGSNITR